MSVQDLTDYEYAHKRLSYDPETGIFIWKEVGPDVIADQRVRNIWNSKYAMTPAGSPNTSGYIRISVVWRDGTARDIRLHRLAWLMTYGDWPEKLIDHINGIPDDNSIKNLRDVSERQNQTNRRYREGESGVFGVTWSRQNSKWMVRISNQKRKQVYLGCYDDFDEAVSVRKQAERDYGYHENHGR